MSLAISSSTSDGTVTMTLAGSVDSGSAPQLQAQLTTVPAAGIRRLVLDVAGVTYLSSAGVRCLVYAHQLLGRQVEIVVAGARPEVAETIRLTGFDRSVVLRDGTGS